MTIYPPVRTFHARHGRMSEAKKAVLRDVLPYYEVAAQDGDIDLRERFPGLRTIIDFGAGMGAHSLELAAAGVGVLSVDVHSPGVCNVASFAHEHGLTNIAVHFGDGVALLTDRITPGSIDEVHVLFPDPWPKARHHKRRLVNHPFLVLAHRVLVPGGRLVIVSDDASYTEHIVEILHGTDLFTADGAEFVYLPTGYHDRALRLENTITTFSLQAR